MEKFEVICLTCPLACNITLSIQKGKIIDITGFKCDKGKEYALEEYRSPQRVLTATVRTTDRTRPLLPVRTAAPIPKELLMSSMKLLVQKEVRPPIRIGQIVMENIMNTGVNLISTQDFL
jgi:CxxC motif-containing protein